MLDPSQPTLGALNEDCTNKKNYDLYAICFIRDDITDKLRIVFLIILALNFILLTFNIRNLFMIHQRSKFSNVMYMKIFNILLLPTILLQMSLYANSLWIVLGMEGYSVLTYQILEVLQVIVLNSIFALGAFLWMKMILRLSLNNAKVRVVKIIFIMCSILNLAFVIGTTISAIVSGLSDDSYWLNVKDIVTQMYLFVAISTIVNGLFFSLGVVFGLRIERQCSITSTSSNKIVSNLAVLAALVSALRVIQDFIQSLSSVIEDMKKNSVCNDDWIYPIYLMFFLIIANIVPETIFLIRYSPKRQPRLSKQSHLSCTNLSKVHNEEPDILEDFGGANTLLLHS